MGWGVFAKRHINAGEIIGEYTGLIKKVGKSMNYSWKYPSSFAGYEEL